MRHWPTIAGILLFGGIGFKKAYDSLTVTSWSPTTWLLVYFNLFGFDFYVLMLLLLTPCFVLVAVTVVSPPFIPNENVNAAYIGSTRLLKECGIVVPELNLSGFMCCVSKQQRV